MTAKSHRYVLPLLPCRSQGGNHDDDAVTVGFLLGQIHSALAVADSLGVHSISWVVRTDLVKQLDLFGLDRKLLATVTPTGRPGLVLMTFTVGRTDDTGPGEVIAGGT